MTHTVSIFAPVDQDAERRQALAKVYCLLIRLAEEIEESSATEQKAVEPASATPVLLESNIPVGQ